MNFVPNSQFQGAAAPFVLPVAYQNMSSNNSTFIPCPSVNFSDPRFGAYRGFGMASNGFVHPQMQASLSGYEGHDPQTNPLMYMQAMQAMNSRYNTMRTSTTVNSNTNTASQITEHSSQTQPVGRCPNDELVLINALIVGRGGGLSDGQAIRKSLHMVRTLFCLQTKYVLGVEY